jgi:hypothetical protein
MFYLKWAHTICRHLKAKKGGINYDPAILPSHVCTFGSLLNDAMSSPIDFQISISGSAHFFALR